jgi:hypothetical protein
VRWAIVDNEEDLALLRSKATIPFLQIVLEYDT